MIIFRSNNVYDVCKESQLKSYTDSTVNSPSSIADSFHGCRGGISKLFLLKTISRRVCGGLDLACGS